MNIRRDNLRGSQIAALLQQHVEHMRATSPPESTHTLDIQALREPEVSFWSAWQDQTLLGCGALKELSTEEGEIKSMCTAEGHTGKGVASGILQHIINEAQKRSYQRLLLETGSMDAFSSARKLYQRFGFTECDPFSDYKADPYSVFYVLEL